MSKKSVAIHQPNYLPWMGYMKKIYLADAFVFLDHVQYTDKGEVRRNWNTIKGANGRINLTVPTSRHMETPINQVKVLPGNWRKKHLNSIEFAYKKAPYFNEVYQTVEAELMADYQTIDKLNEAIILAWLRELGVTTPTLLSSDMQGIVDYKKQDLVIEICKRLGADVYISGNGARAYQSEQDFQANGIELTYLSTPPIQYRQLWGAFEPNLSALDYFMNEGFKIPDGWKEEKERGCLSESVVCRGASR